ncbi:MAG: PorP/SprF family type IX secretion system membrane protein [Bacteroidetes bacterium]|nr:PorP/SprF family type IX secretion system membrane protein [Bacteroidota bacterium]MBM3424577.1 type IX secretion system membrane protein PorP/SprF [Bacteroidota bacterium]
MRKLPIIALMTAVVNLAYTQQVPQSYLYGYNSFLINPASSGLNNCTELTVAHHNQWVKIDGAPITNHLLVSTRIKERWGIGGQFMMDKIGMLQQVSALGNVSYSILNGNQTLRLGISIGYNNYRINPSNAVAFDLLDPIVNGGNQSAGAISSDFGAFYRNGALELFGTVKQLVKTYSNFGYANLPGYGQRPHFMIGTGYQIKLNNAWGLRPNALYKSINNVNQVDVNVDAQYKKFLHLGAGFRTQVGLMARAGIVLKEKFFFGYAYEAPIANIASYSSGSHELMLKMTLCKPERAIVSKVKIDTIVREIQKIDTVLITQTRVDTVYLERAIENTPENEPKTGNISKTVLFEFDKSLVKKDSYGELESIVNLLKMNPSYKLSLEGHTDAVGTESYNIGLSKNRVNAVRDFIIMNGISPDRIVPQHHGETKPVADNSNPDGRKSNRRVDVEIIIP